MIKVCRAFNTIGISCFLFVSCMVPLRSFDHTAIPSPPDYSQRRYWAALPDQRDSADFQLPAYGIIDGQKNAKADVFFIPPSNYLSGSHWNASVEDEEERSHTERIGCKLVASAYNASCKVYAPHYRDAILLSYLTVRRKDAKKAFALAYSDIKAAFLYYLNHYNQGRPIVIASHSQGTDYAIRLVKEFFDKDTSLKERLIAAYLIGRPIYDTTFKLVKAMNSAEETGGFVTWNTVHYHINTFYGNPVGKIVGVNPLSWKRDTAYVSRHFNKGGLSFKAVRVDTAIVDAKLAPSGFLWVHPPSIKLVKEYPNIETPYYHKDDYAFFYMNIRENVGLRVEAYLKKQHLR